MRARVRRRFRKAFFFVLSSLLLFVAFPILSQRLRGFTDAPRPPLARSELETDWILEPSGKLVIPLDDDGNAIPRSGKAPGHPISQLVKEAAEGWELMVSRQSKTLQEAVAEYKRRYERAPPKGFDIWYDFASKRDVILIDEFDTINHEILPFLALPPDAVRERVDTLAADEKIYHLEIKDGTLSGDLNKHELGLLFQDFVQFLPDLKIAVNPHDVGPGIMGEDMRHEAQRVVSEGGFFTPDNITFFESKTKNVRKGLTKACLDTSPAVQLERGQITPPTNTSDWVEFIYDHHSSKDFCNNPAILRYQGHFLHPPARPLDISPFFVRCKLLQGGGMLIPSTYSWHERDGSHVPPWESRNLTKLFWRGSTTGSHFFKKSWRDSHRNRLHFIATSEEEEEEVPILVEEANGRLRTINFSPRELNKAYMDVGLAGKVIQCDKKDGACEDMEENIKFLPRVSTPHDPYWGGIYWGQNHKYTLDVDGNGWSGRFQGLLAGGSVVFKASIFPEWNSRWLTPYYHYIPIQHDYTDLYNAMVFFAGTPHGLVKGHEELAEQISRNAVEFVAKHWRWEDMQAYTFLLLLEYVRLLSTDREAMSYYGTGL